jgi:mannosyltransferase
MRYRRREHAIAGNDDVVIFKYSSHNPQIVQVAGRTINKYSVALLVILLIGVFLRVYDLGTQSLWWDESYSVWISKMGLSQIVATAAAGDNHPPLYYLLLHYWTMLFGTSEVVVRLPSVLFGVLAIPMTYAVGRRLFKEEVGLFAALILAFSTFNIQYSQEARMYSLMLLLVLLSMYFFIRFLQRNTVAVSVGYVLCTTLLLYTHVYGAFVVIAQNVCLLTLLCLSREHAVRLRHWITLQVLLVAFFAPWIRVLTSQISYVEQGFWISSPTMNDLIVTLYTYAGTTNLLRLFFALCVLSLFTYRKLRGSVDWKAPVKALRSYAWEVSFTKDYGALYFLTVWLLAINFIPFVISLYSSPVYLTRYTIAASVALYLIVAKGISHINYRYAKLAVVIVVVVLSAPILQTYYTAPYTIMDGLKPQIREATGFINENAKNGDLVLLFPAGTYSPSLLDYYSFVAGVNVTKFPLCSTGEGLATNIKELQSDINGHNRVWFMARSDSDPQVLNSLIQTFDNASYNTTYFKSYLFYEVYLFEKQA